MVEKNINPRIKTTAENKSNELINRYNSDITVRFQDNINECPTNIIIIFLCAIAFHIPLSMDRFSVHNRIISQTGLFP